MWRATICFHLVIGFVSAGRQLSDNLQNENLAAIWQDFSKRDLASALDGSNRLAHWASSRPKSNRTALDAKLRPCENNNRTKTNGESESQHTGEFQGAKSPLGCNSKNTGLATGERTHDGGDGSKHRAHWVFGMHHWNASLGGDRGAALLHTSSVSSDANGHGYHLNSNGAGKSGLSRGDPEGDHGGDHGGHHEGHLVDQLHHLLDHKGHEGDHGGHGGHGGDHGGHGDGGDHGGHGGDHGGHEGDHGGGHVHETPDKHRQSFLAGMLLVGFMIFNMSSLYLTNSSDPQVKCYTFKTFSLMIAIFCAVLIEKTQHHLLVTACHALGLSHRFEYCVMLVISVCWFLAISASCKRYAHDHPRLFAISEGIITHVAAFLAIETIVGLQERGAHIVMNKFGAGHPINAFYFGTCVVIIIVMALWLKIASWVRARYLGGGHAEPEHNEHGNRAPAPALASANQASLDEASDRCQKDEGESQTGLQTEEHLMEHDHSGHAWQHVAAECEMEAWAIVFGSLFDLFHCALIDGGIEVQVWDCEIEFALERKPCRILTNTKIFFCCITLGAILCFVVYVAQYQQKHKDDHKIYEICNTIEAFACFSFAFILTWLTRRVVGKVKAGQWEPETVDMWSSLVTSKTLNAVTLWPIYVICVFMVDLLIDKGIIQSTGAERVIQGISLSMAVTVEGAYAVAIDTVIHETFVDPNPLLLIVCQLCVVGGLLAFLIPAWMQYIVPTAMLPVPKRLSEIQRMTRKDILRSKLTLGG